MKDLKDFPNPPKEIEWDNMLSIFFTMVHQIRSCDPDEIIAVNPTGYSFAMWTAQVLKLPLGSYWPDRNVLVSNPNSKKLMFVDDFLGEGVNLKTALEFMKDRDVDWAWSVVFSDCLDPEDLRKMVIQGTTVDHYIKEPFPGSMGISDRDSI